MKTSLLNNSNPIKEKYNHMNYSLNIKIMLFLIIFLPDFTIAQNLITNPGFESGAISSPWSIWVYTNCEINLDSTQVLTGRYSAKVTGNMALLYQTITVEPNKTYKISAHVKNEPGQATYFGAKNYGGDEVFVYFTDTIYTYDSLFFTTGDNFADAEIYIWKQDGVGSAWVDDVTMTTDSTGYIPDEPGGFGTYYISPLGNDTNSGTSPADAWRTIDKVNHINFEPGDQVLFEGNDTFPGNLRINFSDAGTASKRLTISSYGSGRAIINAGTSAGLSALGCKFVSIKKLNFIGDGRKTGNTANGIFLSSCADFRIDSVEISGFQHSGLTTSSSGSNYRFTHIYAHDNGFAGIYVYGLTGNKSSQSNIYIAHCVTDNNPCDPTVLKNHSGNGILVFNASDVTIEYCEASNNGWDMPRIGNGPGGIWVAEVDSAVIQYCIARDNKTAIGAKDGVGFDLDGGTANSVIQYCLSYNNQGSGYGIFQYGGASEWKNNTIRYCISENDGNVSANASVNVWNGDNDNGTVHDLEFNNNTIYNSNGSAIAFEDHYNTNLNFRNNIFVSKDTSILNGVNRENFQGNCWYSLNGEFIADTKIDFTLWANDNNLEIYNDTIVGMFANPMLVIPGHSSITNPSELATVTDYQVADGSPVIDAGLDLKTLFGIDPGTQDYYGNSIKQGEAFDIGVYEYQNKTGIKNPASLNLFDFNIYPNPFSQGKLNIELTNSGDNSEYVINIMSLDGRLLQSKKNPIRQGTNENSFYVSINNKLKKGMYLVSLVSVNKEIAIKKFIIN